MQGIEIGRIVIEGARAPGGGVLSTHRETWKKAERRIAAMFGCKRQVLSGSSGRDDLTASDSTHPMLFLEVKYRERHAVRSLWEATRTLARREKKSPVLGLVDKGRPGFLVVVHSDDLPRLVAEYCGANASDDLEGMIRRAYLRRVEEPGPAEDPDAGGGEAA